MRGSPADVIRPNCTLLKLFCGLFHWNQFSALNDSMRASMRWLPLKRNDLHERQVEEVLARAVHRVALHRAERAHRRRGERRAIVIVVQRAVAIGVVEDLVRSLTADAGAGGVTRHGH